MKKYWKQISCLVAAVVVLAIIGIFVGVQKINAYPGGDADSGKTGGCNYDTGHYCTSWGITWVEQSYEEYMNSKNIVGMTESAKQEMATACDGKADCVIYRLAYVQFSAGGDVSLGVINGQLDVATAIRNGAVYVDPSTIPGGLSKEMAELLYNYALSIGVPMDDGWLNQGAFAFDKAWLECGMDTTCITEKMEEIETTVGVGGATPYFQSKTIIDVGDGIPEGSLDSGWDGFVEVAFSTDSSSVTVNFTHTLDYQPNGFSYSSPDVFTIAPLASDAPDTINNHTSYGITTGGGGDFGVYSTSGGSMNEYASQTVTLSPGETQTVCSEINYGQKYHNIKKKKHITQTARADDPSTPQDESRPEISHMDWYWAGPSGSGSSGACATITRPADPSGSPENPNPGAGNPSGAPSSNVMFAGESTTLKWDINAPTYDTRRLMERQITAHLVNALPGNEGRFFNSSPRSGSDPYGHYSGANIVARHNFGEEGANLDNNPDTYSKAFGVVVPDYVGYKYCHSGGYRYEYWYSINGEWNPDPRDGKKYWYVYNASCRVIAKKPTVAIWNGSILSAGGVTTSSATRYDNAAFGNRVEGGGSRTLYGAWTEYLAAIGRNVNYFASGSSFAIGSKLLSAPKSSPLNTGNSSLTIANKDRLGSSGIFNNSTYRTRLTTFLENQAVRPEGNTLGAMTDVATTQILRYDGDLTITGNITTRPGNYTNIYNVPQVVIFVHGNVKIASDVTQIDAWLIVDGEINTCSQFESGVTEADAVARLRDNYCTKQLVFNGPVLAGNLVLNRSFGSDPLVTRTSTFGLKSEKWSAGEIFNLRADTYLWAYAQAGRYASSYTDSYTRELAPRY